MKGLFKAALAAAAIVGMTSMGAYAQEDKTIKIGTMSWEDLTPITAITQRVLEQAGYTVEVTSFSEWGIAYAALVKGDTQIMTSQIDYAAHDYWERNKADLEKISPVSHGLFQAIAVPKYVTIDSLEQLNDNADKFNFQIIGIEPGSGLMQDAAEAMTEYGITNLQLIPGSTAAMTAALKSATDRQEWIAVAVWEPSWMVQRYDTKWLADPKGVFPPPQGYYWIGQKGFSESHPHAREIIAGIFLPLADNNAINSAVNDGQTLDEAVDAWMAAHEELVARWSSVKPE
jgi:glycine betaine/proline transport system substrate-binding protein